MTNLKPKKTKFGRRKFQKGLSTAKRTGRGSSRSATCNENIYGVGPGVALGGFARHSQVWAFALPPSATAPSATAPSATAPFKGQGNLLSFGTFGIKIVKSTRAAAGRRVSSTGSHHHSIPFSIWFRFGGGPFPPQATAPQARAHPSRTKKAEILGGWNHWSPCTFPEEKGFLRGGGQGTSSCGTSHPQQPVEGGEPLSPPNPMIRVPSPNPSKEGTIRVSSEELQALHQEISRRLKALVPGGGYQIWRLIFPNIGVSKKPAEVKMGKSKGSVEYWSAQVFPGTLLFEIDGVSEEKAREVTRFLEKKTRFRFRLQKEDEV